MHAQNIIYFLHLIRIFKNESLAEPEKGGAEPPSPARPKDEFAHFRPPPEGGSARRRNRPKKIIAKNVKKTILTKIANPSDTGGSAYGHIRPIGGSALGGRANPPFSV